MLPPRFSTSRAAEADDPQRGVMHFAAEHVAGIVDGELRRTGVAIPLDEPAGRGEQEREAHVGRGAIEDARRVSDRDAASVGGGQVDVIDADTEIADHTHARHAVEQGGVDERMAVGVDRLDAFGAGGACQMSWNGT